MLGNNKNIHSGVVLHSGFNMFFMVSIFIIFTKFFAASATEESPIAGTYSGTYSITMWGCPGVCSSDSATLLGTGIKEVDWIWNFDEGWVEISGTTLSVGFAYEVQDVGDIDPDYNYTILTSLGDGLFRVDHGFQIFNPNVGNPRADTSTTFSISSDTDGMLIIETVDSEEDGESDGIPGTQIPDVFPMTVQPQMDGWALPYSDDDTTLSAQTKLALGLHPTREDTDGDSSTDVEELGAEWQTAPLDTDSDSLLDAVEAGSDATDSQVAGGIGLLGSVPGFVTDEDTFSGQTVTLQTRDNWQFSSVRAAPMVNDEVSADSDSDVSDATLGAPGLAYDYGLIAITLRPVDAALGNAGAVPLTLTFEPTLPDTDSLLLYAQSDPENINSFIRVPEKYWIRTDTDVLELSIPMDSTWNIATESTGDYSIVLAPAENTLGGIERTGGAFTIEILAIVLLLFGIRINTVSK